MRSREVRSTRRPETRSSPIGAGFRKIGGRSGRPGSDACGTPLGEPPLATVRIRVTMNRLPSARAVVRLITPFLIAACQPQARRLLLLDLALSDPVVLNGTARPWADAGYKVQYRRFYPHLTRADLPQFRTLVFLLGREPEAASDALTAGDVALLDEWVRRGGVVVLGYDGDGEGYLDRWTANRWLAYEGAGISIGDRVLEDTTLRVVTTGRMQPWVVAQPVGDEPLGSAYDPFPLDRNHAVVTREPTQLLALTSHSAFVRASRSLAPRSDAGVAAAARIGEGLVVVMSRHALGTLGPQYRPSTTPFLATGPLADTYAFLRAVARWTRRPAEWARDAVRRAWSDAVSRLGPTSVAWIPAFDYGGARLPPADSSRGPRGEALPVPCVLDTALWVAGFAPAAAALGRLAADQRTLVIALGFDLGGPLRDPPPPAPSRLRGRSYGMGQEFCDAAWRRSLTQLGRRGAALDSLPYAARYGTLREAGLLPLYYRALQDEVAERAGTLRDRILRQRRDVYFAFRLPQSPADWFSLGLLKGFALPDRPLLLFTPEAQTRDVLGLLRARGLNGVHAVELAPALLRTRDWAGLKRLVFEENDGFWLPGEAGGAKTPGRLPADSLVRLLRRLAR